MLWKNVPLRTDARLWTSVKEETYCRKVALRFNRANDANINRRSSLIFKGNVPCWCVEHRCSHYLKNKDTWLFLNKCPVLSKHVHGPISARSFTLAPVWPSLHSLINKQNQNKLFFFFSLNIKHAEYYGSGAKKKYFLWLLPEAERSSAEPFHCGRTHWRFPIRSAHLELKEESPPLSPPLLQPRPRWPNTRVWNHSRGFRWRRPITTLERSAQQVQKMSCGSDSALLKQQAADMSYSVITTITTSKTIIMTIRRTVFYSYHIIIMQFKHLKRRTTFAIVDDTSRYKSCICISKNIYF